MPYIMKTPLGWTKMKEGFQHLKKNSFKFPGTNIASAIAFYSFLPEV